MCGAACRLTVGAGQQHVTTAGHLDRRDRLVFCASEWRDQLIRGCFEGIGDLGFGGHGGIKAAVC